MSYYRPRVPSWLWVTLLITAGLFAVVVLGRATVASIKDGERQRVYREAHQWASATVVVQRERFAKERDSLRRETGKLDTVLDVRIKRLRDTTWLPADPSPVVRLAACRVQLDTLATECEAFRATATATMAADDSLRKADSLRIAGLIMGKVADKDSIRTLTIDAKKGPTWTTVGKGVLGGAITGAIICAIKC